MTRSNSLSVSTASTPRRRSAACGRVRNETTTPMVSVRPRLRRRAAGLGEKPSSSITDRIRSRVRGLTTSFPFSALEAVATLTPAWRATSRIVTDFLGTTPSVETGYISSVPITYQNGQDAETAPAATAAGRAERASRCPSRTMGAGGRGLRGAGSSRCGGAIVDPSHGDPPAIRPPRRSVRRVREGTPARPSPARGSRGARWRCALDAMRAPDRRCHAPGRPDRCGPGTPCPGSSQRWWHAR